MRVAAAAGFTVLALAIVLQDIIDLRDIPGMVAHWRLQHTLSLLAVFCVGLAAELTFDAFMAGRRFVGRGLALVTVIGLALLCYNSGGRQAEAGADKANAAKAHNGKIADAKQRLKDAVAAKAALDASAIETSAKKDCGRNCKDLLLQSQTAAQAEITAARAAVAALPAPMLEGSTKAQFWADTLAPIVPPRITVHIAERLEYVLWTLLAELGCMVSWCFVRDRHTPATVTTTATVATVDVPLEQLRERFFATDDDNGPHDPTSGRRRKQPKATVAGKPTATIHHLNVGNRAQKVAEAEALAWLREHIERNGCLDEQDAMAADIDVHKGSVAKWMRKWEAEGLIQREQVGRRKVVRLVAG